MKDTQVKVRYLKSSCCHKVGTIRPMSKSIAKVLVTRGVVEYIDRKTPPVTKNKKHICMSEL